jgi:hypothetical protein
MCSSENILPQGLEGFTIQINLLLSSNKLSIFSKSTYHFFSANKLYALTSTPKALPNF